MITTRLASCIGLCGWMDLDLLNFLHSSYVITMNLGIFGPTIPIRCSTRRCEGNGKITFKPPGKRGWRCGDFGKLDASLRWTSCLRRSGRSYFGS